MTDQDALRTKAEKLAAEKYPPVTVRGDDVFEAPRIAFIDGYLTRAAEPITVSRGKYADALAAVQLCIYEAKVGDYDIDPFELEDHITEHIGEDDD